MKAEPAISAAALPSAKRLAGATATALAVAALLLVVAVLPVEYGIDPLGAGKALGLLRAQAPEEAPAVTVLPGDAGLAPARQGNVALYDEPYRVNSIELVLEPYEYVEYKYHLAEGAGMVFSWQADGKLTHDFHGEPDGNPEAVRSYDKSAKNGANGSFTAPMTGIHGWFWENPGNKRITIRLTSAGFYSHAMEFRSDKSRKRLEVETVTPQPAQP